MATHQADSSAATAGAPGGVSANNAPFTAPSIALPKGGGAIRGIGEKFAANPVTGTGSLSVPIAASPGRDGFGPQLTLTYDSGAGNGIFGFGWSLGLPQITRKTDKGLPRYDDAAETDVFLLSGAEDLVPLLVQDARGRWQPETPTRRAIGGRVYTIRRYRPRLEGLFARIERWTRDDGDVHWRSISKDNVLTLYGQDDTSRIADPADSRRIFAWLICESRDDRGNAVLYEYKPEDAAGLDLTQAHEANRGAAGDPRRQVNRHIKHIRYGNRVPLLDAAGRRPAFLSQLPLARRENPGWMFQLVFDYGEHDDNAPTPAERRPWLPRHDPFASYRAGFEVRTCRRCRRVLVFHHFPNEADVGADCLVRSTDFDYSHERDPNAARDPVYSFLFAVNQRGYRREGAGYLSRSLPPLAFDYTRPIVQSVVEEVDPTSLENLPAGLGGGYQWTDLHGEGIPGILTEQDDAWFYKRNLSPINEREHNGVRHLEACFGPVECVASRPNLTLGGGAQFLDLAGDGLPDLVALDGPLPGLYEHDDGESWQPFRPFTARLNRAMADPNLRFVDLDGDGHADVLITEDDAFVWHPSLAEAGFGPAERVAQALDEEKGPRLVFAGGEGTVFLADLSGDGLTDLVRIRNGEVCYWPNLGYGRFGPKIAMDNAPLFDNPDQFDPRRLRLADVDGSGTTDILYLHRDGIRLYFNQSGNGWSAPQAIDFFPRVDSLSDVTVTDLLGNGTACLVWSSPLPGDARRPMRYVNLMGDEKPHLLVGVVNNLGAETRIRYAPSTKFYLQDRLAGRPWITRLPFPVHVVERVETYDHVSRNRFVTTYAYHHGYFDGDEREFRGFGMVEQTDTEAFAALTTAGELPPGDNENAANHVPPVLTRTWFHTGVYLGRDRVSRFFAGLLDAQDRGEYYREPGLTDPQAAALLLDDTILPDGLTLDEERQAARALKGMMLRQEVYALDGVGRTLDYPFGQPYTVAEQNFTVRLMQPQGDNRRNNRHAVFFAHPREALTYHYERQPGDPRIQHGLTLEVDDFGNVLKSAAVGYGRRASPLRQQWDRDRQTTTLVTYSENDVTAAITDPATWPDDHRAPLPAETRTYELTGYPPTGPAGRYRAGDFVAPDPADPRRLIHVRDGEAAYEQTPPAGKQRRLIERVRTLYRADDMGALLPRGQLEPLALPGESYKLALTPGLLTGVMTRDGHALLPNPAAVLAGAGGDRGGYIDLDGDGHWWIPSGRVFYHPDAVAAAAEWAEAEAHFFRPRRFRDPFGQNSAVAYDGHDLLPARTEDAVANVARAENDYRVLQPRLLTDPNGNRTEVAFDALGLVAGTAVMGKAGGPAEGDSLAGFAADLTPAEIDSFYDAAVPHTPGAALLGNATTRIIYDLNRFMRDGRPSYAATLSRETHVSDPLPPDGLKIQLNFSYSDGFGREIQKKIQAEPGPVVAGGAIVDPRWVGSGWTIFNNKGKPVRQYEPFFADTHEFEFGVTAGVSPILFYDPPGRVVATLHPNHTWEKVVFDPWQQETWDVNDTVTLDPAADADVKGFFVNPDGTPRLPANEYQPAWHALRTDPAHAAAFARQYPTAAARAAETAAAGKAAAHAATPTTAHFDALGRPFLTVAHNKVTCPGHTLDGTESLFHTRVELDIEGNQRAVRDADEQADDRLGRVVMRYDYDMLGNRIHQASMEAGQRWTLADATGKPIRVWDSRGHEFTTTYDALRRPLAQTVRGTTTDSDPRTRLANPLLVDLIEYGEPPRNATPAQQTEAQRLNLRTRVTRHFDSAGILTNARLDAAGAPVAAYDFKGNLLHSTRRLVSDYTAIPDWSQNPALDAETFEGSTRYDALNRPVQSIAPHSSLTRPGHPNKYNVIQPVFNEANLLERVDVWLERAAEPAGLLDPTAEAPSSAGVANIDYNAKGQRTRIDYKNGASTFYDYDPLTFRLTHLYTRRGVAFTADCDNPTPPPATSAAPDWPPPDNACGLQNLRYTYDPAGNISHIRDDAQQTLFFYNRRVEPSNDYVYDAVYRLIQAEGREHLGLVGGAPIAHSHDDAGRVGRLSAAAGRFAANNGDAMGAYVERYVYDAAGNFLQMQHHGSVPAHPGWTRAYTYNETSLLEDGAGGSLLKRSNRLSSTQVGNGPRAAPERYTHDAHGNMTRMPHLSSAAGPNMHWDYRDRLRQTDLNGAGTAWYTYDAAGQRVRKVWRKAPGLIEERITLGGFEIFRRHGGPIGPATATLERETLHVMDDQQRIALVETRTLDTAGTDPSPRQLIRYQLGNHLGSAVLELDDGAEIISYEEYAPYGSTTYQAVRSRTEAAKRYRYTGKERDEETGLNYHGARYYAAWLARWTAADPIGLGDGNNLYAYLSTNPITQVDLGGLSGEPSQIHLIQQSMLRQPVTATATGPGISQSLRLTYQNLGAQWGWTQTDVGHPEDRPFALTPAGMTTRVYPQEASENRRLGASAEKARIAEVRKSGGFVREKGVDTTAQKGTRYGQPPHLETLKDVKAPKTPPAPQVGPTIPPVTSTPSPQAGSPVGQQLELDFNKPVSTSKPSVAAPPAAAKPPTAEVSGGKVVTTSGGIMPKAGGNTGTLVKGVVPGVVEVEVGLVGTAYYASQSAVTAPLVTPLLTAAEAVPIVGGGFVAGGVAGNLYENAATSLGASETTAKGAGIGGAILSGAAVGALIGSPTGIGAPIGAVIGGAAGLIGYGLSKWL